MHTHLVLTVIVLMSTVPGGSITYTSAIHKGQMQEQKEGGGGGGGGGSSMKNGGKVRRMQSVHTNLAVCLTSLFIGEQGLYT